MNENIQAGQAERGTNGVLRLLVFPAMIFFLMLRPALLSYRPDDLTVALALGGVALMLLALDRRAGGTAALLGAVFALLHHQAEGAQVTNLTALVYLYAAALALSLALFPQARQAAARTTPGE